MTALQIVGEEADDFVLQEILLLYHTPFLLNKNSKIVLKLSSEIDF